MRFKQDSYFFGAGLFIPALLIGSFVFFSIEWAKAPDMEIVVEFWTILSVVTLMGLIPWICFWRLWFSFYQIDDEGFKQRCILCKPIVIRWTDCTDCGICRVQNGLATWLYYIYISTIPLTQAQKLGLVTMKKGPPIWGKTALRILFSNESIEAVERFAPAPLANRMKCDPMYPKEESEKS